MPNCSVNVRVLHGSNCLSEEPHPIRGESINHASRDTLCCVAMETRAYSPVTPQLLSLVFERLVFGCI